VRLAIAVLAVALCALPTTARTLPQPYIEAYCDGGIDGRYQHARVDPDGTVTATNRYDTPEPWPTVATDTAAAKRWFDAIESASPVEPPDPKNPPVADGIECGLLLYERAAPKHYDLPEIHNEIVRHVPGYH